MQNLSAMSSSITFLILLPLIMLLQVTHEWNITMKDLWHSNYRVNNAVFPDQPYLPMAIDKFSGRFYRILSNPIDLKSTNFPDTSMLNVLVPDEGNKILPSCDAAMTVNVGAVEKLEDGTTESLDKATLFRTSWHRMTRTFGITVRIPFGGPISHDSSQSTTQISTSSSIASTGINSSYNSSNPTTLSSEKTTSTSGSSTSLSATISPSNSPASINSLSTTVPSSSSSLSPSTDSRQPLQNMMQVFNGNTDILNELDSVGNIQNCPVRFMSILYYEKAEKSSILDKNRLVFGCPDQFFITEHSMPYKRICRARFPEDRIVQLETIGDRVFILTKNSLKIYNVACDLLQELVFPLDEEACDIALLADRKLAAVAFIGNRIRLYETAFLTLNYNIPFAGPDATAPYSIQHSASPSAAEQLNFILIQHHVVFMLPVNLLALYSKKVPLVSEKKYYNQHTLVLTDTKNQVDLFIFNKEDKLVVVVFTGMSTQAFDFPLPDSALILSNGLVHPFKSAIYLTLSPSYNILELRLTN
jgi:hypothetical protein